MAGGRSIVPCAVCMEPIRAASKRTQEAAVLRCGHELHLSCLMPCVLSAPLEREPWRHRCPVCRCEFSGDLLQSLDGCYRQQGSAAAAATAASRNVRNAEQMLLDMSRLSSQSNSSNSSGEPEEEPGGVKKLLMPVLYLCTLTGLLAFGNIM